MCRLIAFVTTKSPSQTCFSNLKSNTAVGTENFNLYHGRNFKFHSTCS